MMNAERRRNTWIGGAGDAAFGLLPSAFSI